MVLLCSTCYHKLCKNDGSNHQQRSRKISLFHKVNQKKKNHSSDKVAFYALCVDIKFFKWVIWGKKIYLHVCPILTNKIRFIYNIFSSVTFPFLNIMQTFKDMKRRSRVKSTVSVSINRTWYNILLIDIWRKKNTIGIKLVGNKKA